jgi:acyl CoA:acetate/3-ketoacid CoA transferase beta subunit
LAVANDDGIEQVAREIDETGMTLTELAPDVTLAEIAERTDARY